MKFQHILLVSLLVLTLAACNFSLAEDIAPPPGSELVAAPTAATTAAPVVATAPAVATPAEGLTPASATPANTPNTTPGSGGVTISGKVSNGSGGAFPGGLTVTLHGILNQQETLSQNQPLNPDGSYSFENVALSNGTEIIAVVPYGPVSFLSEGAVFDGTQTSYDQPVTIYEASSELSGLSLDQVHIQASFATAGEIQLNEIYVLTNPGKTAVTIATDGSSLPFTKVPEGALQPSIDLSQGSAPLAMADNGFAVLPGQQYAFVVTFSLPYSANKASLSQPFVLSPASVTVIVPGGVKVTGTGLTDQGTNAFQGSNFQIYSSGSIKAGAALDLSFSGSPQAAVSAASTSNASSKPPAPALLIGLGALGLLLVAAGVIFFLRDRRRALRTDPGDALEPEPMDDETVVLADAILALDDRFADGKIDAETYAQQRAELKEKLKGLI